MALQYNVPSSSSRVRFSAQLRSTFPNFPLSDRYQRGPGISLLNRGDNEKALQQYGIVMKLNPKDPDNLFFGAIVYERLNKKDEAIVLYRKVLAVNPQHTFSRQRLRQLELEQ